jgi:hypothetical protein
LTGKGISPVQKREAHRILASNALKISALAFMYAALVSDDEDYQKMDPAIRDRHLLIPGTSVMLPMRSDLTLMPKLIAEYTYLGMTDNGFTDGKKIRRAMTDSITNAVLSPTVAPQAIKPALEVLVNYDFFTNRPIIGQGIANKVTEEQYTNNTSELGKLIGSSGMIAPVNVDHLIKGYMGTTGGLSLMLTNAILNGTEDQPKPEKSWRDTVASTPGLSAFVSREYGNADKNDFYELRKDVDKAVTTFNAMKKQGRIEDAKEFFQENKDYRFNYVILDESQNIKNPNSQRHKTVRLLNARNRIVMTGTPIENNVYDIFGQMSFLNPGLLGNRQYFKDMYVMPIDKFYDEKGDEIAEISLNHSILVEYRLKYFYNHDTDKWISQSVSQTIQKKDITDKYDSIKEEIINKYF